MSNFIQIELCEICREPISGSGKYNKQVPHDGLEIEFGFSRGGWGHRESRFNLSGEVCRHCFNEMWQAFNKVMEVYENLQKDNKNDDETEEPIVSGSLLNSIFKNW